MKILLWALQIILAIKLLTVTFNHGIHPDPLKMQRGRESLGRVTQPLLALISLGVFLVGLALVLPGAMGFMLWLTPWAAAIAALMMLIATGFHLRCRETPNTWVSLIVFTLASFLAYGRWVINPI